MAIKIVKWTDHAYYELKSTVEHLEENWTDNEIRKLNKELTHTLLLISKNPYLFKSSNTVGVRKVVILKFNTLYYRFNNETIEVISFFSNRQDPYKVKL